MTELERRLLALEIAVPEEPDLAPAVLARVEGRPFPWRRAAVLALAMLAVAIAAAFAVPQARTTILHWFHVGGATIERVETVPPAVERSTATGLGRPLPLKEAEGAVGFHLLLPPYKCCGPARVYVLRDSLATVVVGIDGHRALLSEFRSFGPFTLEKLVFQESGVEPLRVNGRRAVWIQGGTHALRYYDKRRGVQEKTVLIHGNVLIWVHDGLTLRLEAKLGKTQAVAFARDMR